MVGAATTDTLMSESISCGFLNISCILFSAIPSHLLAISDEHKRKRELSKRDTSCYDKGVLVAHISNPGCNTAMTSVRILKH